MVRVTNSIQLAVSIRCPMDINWKSIEYIQYNKRDTHCAETTNFYFIYRPRLIERPRQADDWRHPHTTPHHTRRRTLLSAATAPKAISQAMQPQQRSRLYENEVSFDRSSHTGADLSKQINKQTHGEKIII